VVALRHQPRQEADVVKMGVRQDNGVERCRRDRELLPVAFPQLLEPLKQAAIDEDALAAVLQQVLRPGHAPCRAEKRHGRHDAMLIFPV
jgi:hypothetical protein